MGLISAWVKWLPEPDMPPNKQALLLDCFTSVQPYLHLQIVNSLRLCWNIPFKSTQTLSQYSACPVSFKEISYWRTTICQQFPVLLTSTGAFITHYLFKSIEHISRKNHQCHLTDKDHLNSKVAELEPRFPIWKLSIPWCSSFQK